MRPFAACTCLLSLTTMATAVEPDTTFPRLLAQLMVGTAGFEPGIAAEWNLTRGERWMWRVRPEVFINEDGGVGAGGSLAWGIPWTALPDRHSLFIGPRIAWHGDDDWGWEVSGQATYTVPLFHGVPQRHYVQGIGALGIIEDEEDDETDFSAAIGVAYGYQF